MPAPRPLSSCPAPRHGLLAPLLCSAWTVMPTPCPAAHLHEPPQTAVAPCSPLSLMDWCSLLCLLLVQVEPPHVL